jgi:ATP-dependent Clp protease adaptor protein ClpS
MSLGVTYKDAYRDWRAAAPPTAPDTDVEVAVEDEVEERLDDPWKVILYNDDVHSFEEVILQLIKAIGCSVQDAERIAWQAHMTGKAVAFEGTFDECFRVNGVLREIQLVTEIEG